MEDGDPEAAPEPPMPTDLLMPAIVSLAGGAIFLRIVAKEKHRREKYLTMRLEEHIKAQEAECDPEAVELTPAEPDADPSVAVAADQH